MVTMTPETSPFMRLPEVIAVTTLSKPTIYQMISLGLFPKQVRIGRNTVAWMRSEVQGWIKARAAERRAA